ncbi:LexA family transcriptional regulator [Acetobacter estunensis]|uniref:LexA family transcriptional regulator n=1 Tax=Acetobacter estunensis TaxID=104097 RepID=A0A967B499_9PROT|nr:S24 family peptidase [Acetobacter estunensis]NHO53480.1 LexA family transcriptional regulator [Acetobacter estunensis]
MRQPSRPVSQRRGRPPGLAGGPPPDASTPHNRLALAIHRSGKTLRDIREETEGQPALTTIRRHLDSEGVWNPGLIERLAPVLGVSAQWLFFGDTVETKEDSESDLVTIPYYNARASAGFGSVCDQESPTRMRFPRGFVSEDLGLQASAVLIVTAEGDSMLPTIRSGDRLVIDTRETARIEGVYAIVMRGALFVKRVSRTEAGFLVQSDNPIYPPETFRAEDTVFGTPVDGHSLTIIGRVAWCLHRV